MRIYLKQPIAVQVTRDVRYRHGCGDQSLRGRLMATAGTLGEVVSYDTSACTAGVALQGKDGVTELYFHEITTVLNGAVTG